MPKRARFEAIPTQVGMYDGRTVRRMERMLRSWGLGVPHPLDQGIIRGRHMEVFRSFGLFNDFDRGAFANITGRLGLIQRAIRTAIDRRRRQAYLLLRRVLPIELARLTVLWEDGFLMGNPVV